jgi:hypothetical protein
VSGQDFIRLDLLVRYRQPASISVSVCESSLVPVDDEHAAPDAARTREFCCNSFAALGLREAGHEFAVAIGADGIVRAARMDANGTALRAKYLLDEFVHGS